jgi:hypothetical protein
MNKAYHEGYRDGREGIKRGSDYKPGTAAHSDWCDGYEAGTNDRMGEELDKEEKAKAYLQKVFEDCQKWGSD